MNKIILYTIILVTLVSCDQNNKTNNMTTTKYTQQDILDLYKSVKHYEDEVHYGLRIRSANCNFQILINDKKVFFTNTNKIGTVINGAYAPINYGLLKGGLQQISIKMLPPVVDRKTEIKHLKLGNAQLDIEIVADDFMEGESTGEYPIYEWESPKETKYIKGREIPYFTQPELPYFEHKDTFNAEVPFTIDGWSKSVVLFTNDTEKLKILTEEVITLFKELHHGFQNKKLDYLANLVYHKEKIASQQFYHRKEDSKENWGYYTGDYQHEDFTMMPIENFKLVFYGNGKMVALEQIIPFNQWDSALYSRYIKKNDKTYSYTLYRFLLHRPKEGAKLEVI